MLFRADHLSDLVSGKSVQWKNAYGHPSPRGFVQEASVWFTSYPIAIITRPDRSVLQTLGSETLIETFQEIGIEGIHTGPMKRAGGISGRRYTPSVDGLFDRIELTIDPLFGTDEQYQRMTRKARRFEITIIGDLVPAHTGKGPDFRLAERAYKNYEGLYVMVEIPRVDWGLLGTVPPDADSVNLSHQTVQLLEDKGYIPGPLQVIPFYDPGIKDTNWSATEEVVGVDGRRRRWVYLHVFKAGQPSFNWLDPTFGAQRIVMADAVQALLVLGTKGLRLDANALLGVERKPGADKSWVEGHPLAQGGSDMIAMMVRKLGGYTFQELNLSLDELKRFSKWGSDLSYDFVTRPAYLYAVATGDARIIRLVFRLMLEEAIDPAVFVHALQNHDELMFDLSHLRKHGEKTFSVDGQERLGKDIYQDMYERAKEKVLQDGSCIREFSNLGFCGTLAAFAAASLGISDPYKMTPPQKSEVLRLHFLAAVFNAMQPGVFALSGWDLVGALPVPDEKLGSWMADRDGRWINRGAFDLMGVNPGAEASRVGLPRAVALYGSLPDQLRDPESFASRLKEMLRIRKESKIALSKLVSAPVVESKGLLVTLLEREDGSGWLVTVLNFGREAVRNTVSVPLLAGRTARRIFSTSRADVKDIRVSEEGNVSFELDGLQGDVYAVS